MDESHQQIEAFYRQRREVYAAAERRGERRSRWLTHARTLTFLAAAACLAFGWLSGHGPPWYWLGALIAGAFFALATYHENVVADVQRQGLLRQINVVALARLRRDWKSIPETPVDIPPAHQDLSDDRAEPVSHTSHLVPRTSAQQALADDLDLLGHASVFHLLCAARTPIGIRTLRDWLFQPAEPDEIRRRQQAVAELAPLRDLRETLALDGWLLTDRTDATERFLAWAESEPWLSSRPWLLWFGRATPTVAALLLILGGLHVLDAQQTGVGLLLVLALNFLASVAFAGRIHDVFSLVNARSGKVRQYLRMFELMYSLPDTASELAIVKHEATRSGGGVLRRLRQLRWLARLADIQHSSLTFAFAYLPLQFGLLYDFHVLNLLEVWQKRYGRYARDWFRALGKFEALASLATLAHDHPEWTMPTVDAAADRFRAVRLGHPLLTDSARVANDVEVGPAGSFLLVTGSNMSGKSTLLRAIGVNAVLAQAGAPVCASRLTMPPVVLATSMRVRDSLECGVSFYMAELMRLKDIVDLARRAELRRGRALLYLLDEILLGTNSRERHIAVVRVLDYLLHHGAVGAISTHDLELATTEPLSRVCVCVHFRETLHDRHAERPMTFDYQLRPGVATTTNALKLLEIVGLGEDMGRGNA